MNAPFTWPKSSLSTKPAEIALRDECRQMLADQNVELLAKALSARHLGAHILDQTLVELAQHVFEQITLVGKIFVDQAVRHVGGARDLGDRSGFVALFGEGARCGCQDRLIAIAHPLGTDSRH